MTARVLIIKLGAFGDVILACGAISDIRRHHPEAEITILTSKPYDRVLARHPGIDKVLIDPRKPRWQVWHLLALRQQLCDQGFDTVYDLQDRPRTRGYRRWLEPVTWVGSDERIKGALERHAAQLEAAGLTIHDSLSPRLNWLQEPVGDLPERFVLLIPGCSAKHPQKRWPYYDQLAEQLTHKGIACVTVPGPDELDLCQSIPAQMLLNPDGKPLSFGQLATVAAKAAFVVGNDTGPTHVAAWSGAPGLALFGPHAPAENTSIGRVWDVIEVDDLPALNVETIAALVYEKSR